MASADLYGAVTTFLDGDTGDVITAINAEQPSLLAAGTVTVSRSNRQGREPRQVRPSALHVELIPVPAPPARAVGIGWKEREVVIDMKTTYRGKDATTGKLQQLATLAKVTRALVARYDGVTNLVIPVTGGVAIFRRSVADLVSVDEIPESSDLARASVRAVFVFTEPQALNT